MADTTDSAELEPGLARLSRALEAITSGEESHTRFIRPSAVPLTPAEIAHSRFRRLPSEPDSEDDDILGLDVSVRDVEMLRSRLDLLQEMAEHDRKEREGDRGFVRAALADLEQQVLEVRRDHRRIRQTLGDLADTVNRQSAEGSDIRAAIGQVTRMVDSVDGRGVDTGLAVERLAGDRARQDLEAIDLRASLDHAETELQRHRATELEHVGVLREQLAEATAAIEELGAVAKRQAGQITRLRADLKKAAEPPAPKPAPKATPPGTAARRAAPAAKAAAKKPAAKPAAAKRAAAPRSA